MPLTPTSRIYLAGHTGLVGSALHRRLTAEGCRTILTTPFPGVDLRDQAAVLYWFEGLRPESIVMAAATPYVAIMETVADCQPLKSII
jgi:GDP-L-fucose synthase